MFLKFRKNFYSLTGEDGILEALINTLKIRKPTVCEFGASDGIYASNTYYIVKKFNGRAVYIESDSVKYEKLVTNTRKLKNIICIKKNIDCYQNKLDKILLSTFLKKNFDVLSIDVDGDDLNIWKSLKLFYPKIVLIEINSAFKPGFLQLHNKAVNKIGNSFTSTLNVAKGKGYTLLVHTGNLIFIKNEYLKKINFPKYLVTNPERIFLRNLAKEKYFLFKKKLKKFIPQSLINIIPNKVKFFIIRKLFFIFLKRPL